MPGMKQRCGKNGSDANLIARGRRCVQGTLPLMNRRHLVLVLRIVCGALLLWWAWRQVDAPMRQVVATISLDWSWLPLGILLGGVAVAGWALRWHLFLRLCGL